MLCAYNMKAMRQPFAVTLLLTLAATNLHATTLDNAVSTRYLAQNSNAACAMLGQLKAKNPALCERYITKKHPNCLDELLALLAGAQELAPVRVDLYERLGWIRDDYNAVLKKGAAPKTELRNVLLTLGDRYLKIKAGTTRFDLMPEPGQNPSEIQKIVKEATARQNQDTDSQSLFGGLKRLSDAETGDIIRAKKSLGVLREWLAESARRGNADEALLNDARLRVLKALETSRLFVDALKTERMLGGDPSEKFMSQIYEARVELVRLRGLIKEIAQLTPHLPALATRDRAAMERTLIEAGNINPKSLKTSTNRDLSSELPKIDALITTLSRNL